jgi:ATP-binding cassette subfamily B protein
MKHAATLDLDQFEDSVFYDKLERARQQTVGRTVLLSQVMSQIQDLITMGFLAVGLVAFNPWLIVVLLVTILPAFLGESYFNDQSYALSRKRTPERRELIFPALSSVVSEHFQKDFIQRISICLYSAPCGAPFLPF